MQQMAQKEQMVSLDKVCEYLKSLTYQEFPGGPQERIIDDTIIQNMCKSLVSKKKQIK